MREARSEASGCCNRKSVIQVLCVMLGVLLFSSAISGQTANGRISGTVKDQSGALIPGVAVTVTDTARGVARNLITGELIWLLTCFPVHTPSMLRFQDFRLGNERTYA